MEPISQQSRALAFKKLHERPGLFVIPNPGDAGSASLLAGLGFEGLTTTSAGLARAAYGAFFRAAEEIRRSGTFSFSAEAISYVRLNALFGARVTGRPGRPRVRPWS